MGEEGRDGFGQIVEGGGAALLAGGHDGPNSLGPELAGDPASALGDSPLNGDEAERLFGHIVGRVDVRVGDE